ncbi:DMT family transporter [Tabrizicola sp.]|jgi:drug/metabolite transporter (DMT)-like permease|uniref:DMT family transporter n=1 Tax=Tabrizicola sp. TaxID=2005166 RepID=UPI0025F8363E|nr:DMT family transporter [Tabrizicola sp.]MBY0349674.1 DMT family transporter [Tabrizicola sp.]
MLAVVLSLAAAAAFAASAMFIDSVSGRVGPLQLSRWQMSLAFLMTAAIVAVTGGWQTLDLSMVLWLTASSASGIMVGSLTYIATIQYTGPRISALLFTTASPFALALGFGFRGETVSLTQAAGVGLIVAGIALAVMGPKREEGARTPKPLWIGIGLGLVTSFAQALGSLLARPAMLAGADPVAAMVVRSGMGALFFIALLALPALRPVALPSRAEVRQIGLSALAGIVLGMSFLMAALARGDVGIVTTLSSTTPILILPMVWAVYRRIPGPMAWVGAALAVAGTALISLSG